MTVYEKTMAIKLIIFDFDGTLGDTRRHIVTTMQAAIQELGLPERTEEAYIATIGLPLAGCFETLYPDESQEMRDRYVETYRRIFAENLKRFKPQAFPQVKETMAALREKGFTLTIASSRSHASLVELTKDMQIAESVSYLIGADDVKNAKPHPEPVLNTLAHGHIQSLSFLAWHSGKQVVFSPGTCNYNGENKKVRMKLSSEEMTNSPILKDFSRNNFITNFRHKKLIKDVSIKTTDDSVVGTLSFKNNVVQRTISIDDDSLIIKDKANRNLAGFSLCVEENSQSLICSSKYGTVSLINNDYSKDYGVLLQANYYIIKVDNTENEVVLKYEESSIHN